MLDLIEFFFWFEYFKFVAECQTYFFGWRWNCVPRGTLIKSFSWLELNQQMFGGSYRLSIDLWSFAVKSFHAGGKSDRFIDSVMSTLRVCDVWCVYAICAIRSISFTLSSKIISTNYVLLVRSRKMRGAKKQASKRKPISSVFICACASASVYVHVRWKKA